MENLGIDPSTSRMQSGRSTIWANPPLPGKPAWIIRGIEIFLEKLWVSEKFGLISKSWKRLWYLSNSRFRVIFRLEVFTSNLPFYTTAIS